MTKKNEPQKKKKVAAKLKIEELIISKEELVNAIPKFMAHYGRLPYMDEDDVIINIKKDKEEKDGSITSVVVEQPYKSLKYVKGHFGSTDNMTDYLFEQHILSFKIISDKTDISEKRVKDLMDGKATKVDKGERRRLHVFFNKDFYEEMGHLNSTHCSDCTKSSQCGHPYWVSVISCPKFKKKVSKKK